MAEPECIHLDCICGTDSTVTGGCGCTDYQWNYPLRIYKGLKLAICQPRDLRGLNGEVRVLVFIEHSSFLIAHLSQVPFLGIEGLLQVRQAVCRAIYGWVFESPENYQCIHFPPTLLQLKEEMRKLSLEGTSPPGCHNACLQSFINMVLNSTTFSHHYEGLITK